MGIAFSLRWAVNRRLRGPGLPGLALSGRLPGLALSSCLPGLALSSCLPGLALRSCLPRLALSGRLPGLALSGCLPGLALSGCLPGLTLSGCLPGLALGGCLLGRPGLPVLGVTIMIIAVPGLAAVIRWGIGGSLIIGALGRIGLSPPRLGSPLSGRGGTIGPLGRLVGVAVLVSAAGFHPGSETAHHLVQSLRGFIQAVRDFSSHGNPGTFQHIINLRGTKLLPQGIVTFFVHGFASIFRKAWDFPGNQINIILLWNTCRCQLDSGRKPGNSRDFTISS